MHQMKKQGWTVFDITVALASKNVVEGATTLELNMARAFAPSWEMVKTWNKSQKDKAAEKEYLDKYIPMMRKSYSENTGLWDQILGMDKICFACFCKTGDFCHRTILVGLLKKVADHRGTPCEIIPEGKTAVVEVKKEMVRVVKYYAGIGSRKAPEEALNEAIRIGRVMAEKCWVLRSGGAKGMDSAFEAGAECLKDSGKDILRPKDVLPWAEEELKKCLPSYLSEDGLAHLKPYVRGLLARDMQQILGKSGDRPVEFVVCWTPAGEDDGGTGYAIRCAKRHGIPVYNLKNEDEKKAFYEKYMK